MKKIYKKPLMEEVEVETDFKLLAGSTTAESEGVIVDEWDYDYDDQTKPSNP